LNLFTLHHESSIIDDSLLKFLFSNRVQDNDDLAPLFNEYNDTLRQTYGEYFVADSIESQDENNQALVAEVIIDISNDHGSLNRT
jgi:hypothetical protein